MITEFLNPPQLCPTFGWTHVVTATGGKTIHISGQVGINERGEVVGRGDLRAQTEQALSELAHLLPDSRIDKVWRSPADTPAGPEGSVITVDFTLAGQQFQGLNGGPDFSFTEAVRS